MTITDLKKTPLCAACEAAGGKMVDFHGWLLPVQFKSILAEHKAVREQAGMFDVSHMGQLFVTGKDAWKFLQYINCNNIKEKTEEKQLNFFETALEKDLEIGSDLTFRLEIVTKSGFCIQEQTVMIYDTAYESELVEYERVTDAAGNLLWENREY